MWILLKKGHHHHVKITWRSGPTYEGKSMMEIVGWGTRGTATTRPIGTLNHQPNRHNPGKIHLPLLS